MRAVHDRVLADTIKTNGDYGPQLRINTMKQIIFAVFIGLALCALVLHGLDALFM